jgi:hypothetical protein
MALRVLPCAFPLPYGCWCGITIPFPPSGGPIDKWDEMCKVHDYCYVDGQKDIGCNFIDVFIWPYAWDYVDGKVNTIVLAFQDLFVIPGFMSACMFRIQHQVPEVFLRVRQKGDRQHQGSCGCRRGKVSNESGVSG